MPQWPVQDNSSPLLPLIARHGGTYVSKRSLDKWRYTLNPNRTVVIIGDSLAQGSAGGTDPWPERLARDLGNWMGPRLTTTPGYYGLYRSGGLLNAASNGDREWAPWGTWTVVGGANDVTPYSQAWACLDANATALRTCADGTTTANSTTIGSTATMAFVAGDVGALITGTNIPPNSRIVKVNSATSAVINQRATATGASLSFVLHGATMTWTRNLSTNNNSRIVFDGATNTNTTVTSKSANFQSFDVGRGIRGAGITEGTTIASVTDYQTVTLSVAATATATSVALMLEDARTVQDLSITNGSAIVTSATAKFTSADVGCRLISQFGGGFNQIVSVQSPTKATLQTTAAATLTGQSAMIQARQGMRNVTDMVTASSTTITSNSAAFSSLDVGRHVAGSNIPNNTTISSVTNATTAVLSNAATATGTSGMLTIGALVPTPVMALDILWIDGLATNGTNFTYSTDGGTTWVQVAQTTTGGPTIKKTTVTVTNPTSLIIRANTGPGNSPTTKSQTYQCGVIAYTAVPTTPAAQGVQIFNVARDGFSLSNFVNPSQGDCMAFLDNGLGGWGGLRPDLVIVLFTNDQVQFTELNWVNNLNRLIDRVTPYADIIFIAPFEQSGNGHSLAGMLAWNADQLAASQSLTTKWTSTDGATTNTLATITSSQMGFVPQDVGRTITDTQGKIPGGTTILSVQSSSAATMSANATGTTTSNGFTITGNSTAQASAFLNLYEAWAAQGEAGYTACNTAGLMFDGLHPSQVGHNEIAGRVSRIIRMFS